MIPNVGIITGTKSSNSFACDRRREREIGREDKENYFDWFCGEVSKNAARYISLNTSGCFIKHRVQ